MSTPPTASTPPNGYREPGLHGPGMKLAATSIGLHIVVWCAVLLRFYGRRMTRGGVGLDDWIILSAAIVNIVFNACTITSVYYGFGNPGATLYPPHKIIALQMFWLTQIIYKLVMGLCKMGYLFFYLRIFPKNDSIFRWTTLGTIGVVVGYSIASIIGTIIQCNPMPRAWDKSVDGTCVSLTAFWYANAGYNISTDLIIMFIPLRKVKQLQLRRRRDYLGLAAIFTVGSFVLATSIVRVTTLDPSSKSVDPTAGTLQSTIWTTVECCMAITCSCLPSLRLPIVKIYRRYHPKTQTNSTSHTSTIGTPGRPSFFPEDIVGLNDIGVRTDVEVDFGEKSRESSVTDHNPSHSVMISARELA